MPEPVRARPDAAEERAPALLAAGSASKLTDFARACRSAARAVALYPGEHPVVATTMARLVTLTVALTDLGPFRVQVLADRLLIDGLGLSRPDAAVVETAALLHRHLIGALSVKPDAGADSWRALLLLLARSPEDVRAGGGAAHLWGLGGGAGIDIDVIDYAEVLREKQGRAQTIEAILAASIAGPGIERDEAIGRLVADAVVDPATLDALMQEVERLSRSRGTETGTDTFVSLLRGLASIGGEEQEDLLARFRDAAHCLSASTMLALIERRHRPDATVGDLNVVGAVLDGMTDDHVARFVAGSVIGEHGASERLAHAFSALAPDRDRRKQLLGMARAQLASSVLEDDPALPALLQSVESMLGSYSDTGFVSTDYAVELSTARTRAVGLEQMTDDPPERVAAWLATLADPRLRELDCALLEDLLAVETDPLQWRSVAATAVAHSNELLRAGSFEQACRLIEALIEGAAAIPACLPHASAALEPFGSSATIKLAANQLQQATEQDYSWFVRLCHAVGAGMMAPLAETLADEQNAVVQQRLRGTLLGFGRGSRRSIRQLLTAPKWEVRRTAVQLLRAMDGESLTELIPLLTDPEPLVKREVVHSFVENGSLQAAGLLLSALARAGAGERETLGADILSVRDDRASVMFCHLLRGLDRRALPRFYLDAIEALGTSRLDGAVAVLDGALLQRDWRAPFHNRRVRTAAARSLRSIGTPAALDALRGAAARGSFGTRAAARAALAGRG